MHHFAHITRFQRKAVGFTLVELLVTIAIIATLAVNAFTGTEWAMKSANRSKAVSGMRQLATRTVL